jgi:uncharacterized protein (TIGR02996 family)
MSADAAFIQAILADPRSDTARLVYADWLDDQGDPRGEYIRIEKALTAKRLSRSKAESLRTQLLSLRKRIPRSWLAVFDQPGMMRANPTPFPAGWFGCELEGYREVDGTYGVFAYDTLPPLPVDAFYGDFRWLDHTRTGGGKERTTKAINQLTASAQSFGLDLPDDFRSFMSNRSLWDDIRSCTDCDFNLPRRIVPSPAGEDAFLVRFYSDSQSCAHWYLYLAEQRFHCVVTAGGFYGGDDFTEDDDARSDDQFFYCASSFETFLYRTWIENEIWYALSDNDHTLTPKEVAYLGHYKREKSAD